MPFETQSETDEPTTPGTCRHERVLQLLVRSSDRALRHHSTVGTLSAKMRADEVMAACKVECADASPYREIELDPISQEDAAELLRPHSYLEEMIGDLAELGRSVRARVRRILKRGR